MNSTQEQPKEDKTLFTVEAQKELMNYGLRKSLKIFLIMFPLMLIFIGLLVLIIFKFTGVL